MTQMTAQITEVVTALTSALELLRGSQVDLGRQILCGVRQLQEAGRNRHRTVSTASFHSAHSSSSDSSGTLVSFTGSLNDPEKCESCCPCQCHQNVQTKTPWWLTQLVGSMTFYGNGSFLLNRQICDVKHCRRSGRTRLQATYVAPAWTLLRHFKISYMMEISDTLRP